MTASEICDMEFGRCACTLEPHGDDVAHVCGTPMVGSGVCGGSWFGTPGTDSLRIVSFPTPFDGVVTSYADQLAPAFEAALAMVPLFIEVPAGQFNDMKPGNPVYDAMAEYARMERPGAGFMLVPQELAFDSTLIAQNMPSPIQSEDPALVAMLAGADAEWCTVCGGNGCDMFFCYVTGK